MSWTPPRVSIAIPVWNGERYLADAIESVLVQTCQDLELIICDNASTDGTSEICRSYADQDPRIRYHRNPVNMGAGPNFNLAFRMAQGEFFKWLAADESIEPTFVERCLGEFERHPEAVIVCTNYIGHDEISGESGERAFDLEVSDGSAPERLRSVLGRRRGFVLPIWGLQRSSVMRTTGLIRSFVRSDHVYVAEMALRGTFAQVDDNLHHIRSHREAYHRMYGQQRTDSVAETKWFDSSRDGRRYFPYWRRLGELVRIVIGSGVPARDRAMMVAYLLGPFALRWRGPLVGDVLVNVVGPDRYRRMRASFRRRDPATNDTVGIG